MNRLLPKAISFDIYGTIIDWEGGTVDWYKKFFEKYKITGVSAAEIESAWEKLQFEYIRNYRPFRDVLMDTFKTTAWYALSPTWTTTSLLNLSAMRESSWTLLSLLKTWDATSLIIQGS